MIHKKKPIQAFFDDLQASEFLHFPDVMKMKRCYLKEEKQNDYTRTLSKLATIWTADKRPAAIVTDRGLALMAGLDKVFSSSSHLWYIWHINKNIMPSANAIRNERRMDRVSSTVVYSGGGQHRSGI